MYQMKCDKWKKISVMWYFRKTAASIPSPFILRPLGIGRGISFQSRGAESIWQGGDAHKYMRGKNERKRGIMRDRKEREKEK